MAGETKMIPYNIVSSFDREIQQKIGSQSIINMYIIMDPMGKNPPAQYDLPGILTALRIGDDSSQVCRGFIWQGNYFYAVFGPQVYRIDKNLRPITIGPLLSTDRGIVRISKNENEIIFQDGVEGYVWNFTTQIATFPIPRTGTSAGFPGQPLDVVNLNGYLISISGETDNWNWSGINAALSWDAADTNKLESEPDTCTAIATINQKLFIFGNTICEQWYDDPTSNDEPWQRNNNMLFQFGTQARGSLVTNYQLMIWLASTKNGVDSIKMSDGGVPMTISPNFLNYLFLQYQAEFGISDAVAMMYQENGHTFYEITFPAANATWVYDISTQEWSQRQMNNGDCFIGRYFVNFDGISYVGSGVDNRIFFLDSKIGTYDEESFTRIIIGSKFELPTLKNFAIDRWQFDFLSGVGSSNGINSNPLAYLSLSRDGGETYGNRMKLETGKIGQRTLRTWYNRLGMGTSFIPKLEFSNQVPTAVLSSVITYREGLR